MASVSQSVTSKGQITLRRELLNHPGIKPGERIDFEKLPGGELRVPAAQPAGTIDEVFAILKNDTNKIVTLEEMNEAIATGWAGEQ